MKTHENKDARPRTWKTRAESEDPFTILIQEVCVTLHGFTNENSEKLGNFFPRNVIIYKLINKKKTKQNKKKSPTITLSAKPEIALFC